MTDLHTKFDFQPLNPFKPVTGGMAPPPFHIAHWTAQHPVGKDNILGKGVLIYSDFFLLCLNKHA